VEAPTLAVLQAAASVLVVAVLAGGVGPGLALVSVVVLVEA